MSTLELFFDLVFVFAITQLTAVLAAEPTWTSAARTFMVLGIIYWMYDGYAWMTNTVAPSDPVRRALLLAGMGGFLLIALAIPGAFGAHGWAFGVGYFAVNAIHSGLLLRANPAAMRALAPLNLLSASLVLIGGVINADVAVFLLADVWFRRILRIGVLRFRAAGAAAALASVALGIRSTFAQLLALVVVLAAVLLLEKRAR